MKKLLLLALPVLAVIAALAFYFESPRQKTAMHHHQTKQPVPKNAYTPSLTLQAVKDAMSGYNLILEIQKYQIGMPVENLKPILLEDKIVLQGHAHLYVNGVKIQRVYGRFVHIPKSVFKNGENSIRVTLNNHQHATWTMAGQIIESEISAMVEEGSATESSAHAGHH